MPRILAAQITAFYLFDVGEAIALADVPPLVDGAASQARLAATPPIPPYVSYRPAPLVFDGRHIAPVEGFAVRFKLFDYGVVSFALTRPFAGDWDELIDLGQDLMENARLEAAAEDACRRLMARIAPALSEPRTDLLSEDYLVFALTAIDGAPTSDALVQAHGEDIARLLRGERRALSAQERSAVLEHRLAYFASDLVVPTWNAALVYDTETESAAAVELLEFANSQLLQFRAYDDRLDAELSRAYARVSAPRWYEPLASRRYTRAAHELHAVFIEVNELTERTENVLKVAGDVYAARVLALAAARLGLDRWKASVRDKLRTLDTIYGFAVEQSGIWRGQFLEATIVLILVLELVLILLGIMS